MIADVNGHRLWFTGTVDGLLVRSTVQIADRWCGCPMFGVTVRKQVSRIVNRTAGVLATVIGMKASRSHAS